MNDSPNIAARHLAPFTLFFLTLTFIAPCADAGVIAYWRFEEGVVNGRASGAGSIIDSVGNHNGTASGGPLYRSDVAVNPVPRTGSANSLSLDFINGTYDFVEIPDPTGVLNPSSAFTVEFWMRASRQTQGQELVVDHSHGFRPSPRGTGWTFQTRLNGKIGFAVGTGSGYPEIASTVNVRDDSWHHIAGTFDVTDAGQEIKLYVDGELQRSGSSGGLTAASNALGVVFGKSLANHRFYNGQIDEVRISDEALQPSDFLNASDPSDLTRNGFVDFEDLTILLANWNKEVGADAGNLVNADTTPVNFEDLTVLLADWTGPGPAGSPEAALGDNAVPEPSTLLLALLATLGLSFYRRRRRRAF